jgi:hypothetical protein
MEQNADDNIDVPFIYGPSTQNTRIERLWLDTRRRVLSRYIHMFRDFEDLGMDPMNLIHHLFFNIYFSQE